MALSPEPTAVSRIPGWYHAWDWCPCQELKSGVLTERAVSVCTASQCVWYMQAPGLIISSLAQSSSGYPQFEGRMTFCFLIVSWSWGLLAWAGKELPCCSCFGHTPAVADGKFNIVIPATRSCSPGQKGECHRVVVSQGRIQTQGEVHSSGCDLWFVLCGHASFGGCCLLFWGEGWGNERCFIFRSAEMTALLYSTASQGHPAGVSQCLGPSAGISAVQPPAGCLKDSWLA